MDLVRGGIYRINARNFEVGAFNGVNGFVGIRTKFGRKFLDLEILISGRDGTVSKVTEHIGHVPPGIEITSVDNPALFNVLKEVA